MSLDGKVSIVTGGTGHLGRAVTRRFLEAGARVVVPWHTEESWQELLDGLGGTPDGLAGVRADLTQEARVRDVVGLALDRFGGLDCLLNLAGGFAGGQEVWEMDAATWDRMMALNLRTAFLCSKHALRPMREAGHGRIVNVSSKACRDIQPGSAAYAVAKGGILTLTRALREELKGTGITVNALMPSIIDTPDTRRTMPRADHDRWVDPEAIADVLVALCEDRMAAVDGSVLRTFGGL